MRTWLLAMAWLAMSLAAPAAAQGEPGVSDPRAFVGATYETYRRNTDTPPADISYVYSSRLKALYDAYDAWQDAHQDLVGSVAFDWWTNSQDWGDIVVLSLAERRRGRNRLTITATFRNFDRTDTNRFEFVRQGARWFLDDVINGAGSGSHGWTLSALLRERQE